MNASASVCWDRQKRYFFQCTDRNWIERQSRTWGSNVYCDPFPKKMYMLARLVKHIPGRGLPQERSGSTVLKARSGTPFSMPASTKASFHPVKTSVDKMKNETEVADNTARIEVMTACVLGDKCCKVCAFGLVLVAQNWSCANDKQSWILEFAETIAA